MRRSPLRTFHGDARIAGRAVSREGRPCLRLLAILVSLGLPGLAPAVPAQSEPRPAFVENLGQWPRSIRFAASHGNETLLAGEGWIAFLTPAGPARLRIDGGSSMTVEGQGDLPGLHSFFTGRDPSSWRARLPGHAAVTQRTATGDIEILARFAGGSFEYDVVLAPSTPVERISLCCEGPTALDLASDGSLVMRTPRGILRQRPPRAFETAPDGTRREVAAAFALKGGLRFGFTTGPRTPGRSLVIDPALEWSTFAGSPGNDAFLALALDSAGRIVVAGQSTATTWPVSPSAFDPTFGGGALYGDAVVSVFSADGSTLVASTYLGGSGEDLATALVIGAGDAITIAGFTSSADFPVTAGAAQTLPAGGYDAFLTTLDATASTLIASTRLGGSGDDFVYGLVATPGGSFLAVGHTTSGDFPATPGAFATTSAGGYESFAARLSSGLQTLEAATLLGGAGDDFAWAADLAPDGSLVVAGWTASADHPVTPGAVSGTYGGGFYDGFVARMPSTLSTLAYATFLGGMGDDRIFTVAHDANGRPVAGGITSSPDFPVTPGAFGTTWIGGGTYGFDAFIAKIDTTAGSLGFSTLLAGNHSDVVTVLRVDSADTITFAGRTTSTDWPTTAGAFDATYNGGYYDSIVGRLSSDGGTLLYSTLFGSSDYDSLVGLALHGTGAAIVAGVSNGADHPATPAAFQPSFAGGLSDGVVASLSLHPAGIEKFGASSPSSLPPLWMWVTAMPAAGEPAFALRCTGAPPATGGILVVGAAPFPAGLPFAGIVVHIDPVAPWFYLPVMTSALGLADTPIPLPPGITGFTVYTQYVFANTPGFGGLGTWSASNALSLTFQ